MSRTVAWAILAVALSAWPATAAGNPPDLAKLLLQGCLGTPGKAKVAALARAVGGRPYSDTRLAREQGKSDTTIFPDASRPGEAQRTRTTLTLLLGWDLPGPGAGSLEYREDTTRIDWVDQATTQSTTQERVSRDRSCQLRAPIANGRSIFELYETLLQDKPYGMLISSDRRQVHVFMFDPDQFDTELGIVLDAPLATLAQGTEETGMSRLVLDDGGPRFLDSVSPGVSVVRLTRAALLSGLDHTAQMTFSNRSIELVVQRLSELSAAR